MADGECLLTEAGLIFSILSTEQLQITLEEAEPQSSLISTTLQTVVTTSPRIPGRIQGLNSQWISHRR